MVASDMSRAGVRSLGKYTTAAAQQPTKRHRSYRTTTQLRSGGATRGGSRVGFAGNRVRCDRTNPRGSASFRPTARSRSPWTCPISRGNFDEPLDSADHYLHDSVLPYAACLRFAIGPIIHHTHTATFALRHGKWKIILGQGENRVLPTQGKGCHFDRDSDPRETTDVWNEHSEISRS
jgi:hypothetical protein